MNISFHLSKIWLSVRSRNVDNFNLFNLFQSDGRPTRCSATRSCLVIIIIVRSCVRTICIIYKSTWVAIEVIPCDLLNTHQCYQSWYCWFHRVWSDAPDHHIVVFWIHITPLWNWWRRTHCFPQYTLHKVLWHSYRTIQNLYQVLYLFQNETYNSYS